LPPITSADDTGHSLFADFRQAAPGHMGLVDAAHGDLNAGWLVCEGVAGFASLHEGVRRARAAVARGEQGAMQRVPEPVGEFIKDWMARRYAVSQAHAQTVFVLDDASRIWASRLVTHLSQQAAASSQRLHFIHRAIAGATVSLAQVRLTGGAQADSQIYWADARGRGRTSHEVRDAFSANGDVLAVLIGPMPANAFEKVSGMLRAQWELRRGSLRRVVLLVTSDCPPPRAAVDDLLEDFAGAARAAYVNLSDAEQCWTALLAAAQDLPARSPPAGSAPADTAPAAPTPQPAPMPPPRLLQEGPAQHLLDRYAGGEGLRAVALFNHRGELISQRSGGLTVLHARQGLALRALLAAAGLRPPKHMVMEGDDVVDVIEPVCGMPTLWLWSRFAVGLIAPVHARALSARLASNLGAVLAAQDHPKQRLQPGEAALATG
jgi:hypothetical protein